MVDVYAVYDSTSYIVLETTPRLDLSIFFSVKMQKAFFINLLVH
jgi:hypothetical protein